MQRRSQLVRLALAAALLVASRAWAAPTYNLLDLGTLGGPSSAARGIHAAGQGGGAPLHAFLYSGGAMTDLGTLGGTASFGYGINGAGDVVGAAYDAAARAHAFLYHGTLADLGTLGGLSSSARGINDAGDVVGV